MCNQGNGRHKFFAEDRVPSPPRSVRVPWIGTDSARIEWDRPIDADKIVVRGYLISHGADVGVSIDGEHSNAYTVKNLGL